jgi:hypothetical protein
MRNISEKIGRETQNTHFNFNNFLEHRVVYGIMWKNIVEPGMPQMTIRRTPISCRIPQATKLTQNM